MTISAQLRAYYYHDQSVTIGASIMPFHLERRAARRLDTISILGIEATHHLLAALPPHISRDRVGICIANRVAGWNFGEPEMDRLHTRSHRSGVSAYLATAWFPAAVQGEISIRYGLKGHSKTFVGDGTAFHHAMAYAMLLLDEEKVDAMIVGAVEAVETPFVLRGLCEEPTRGIGFFMLLKPEEGILQDRDLTQALVTSAALGADGYPLDECYRWVRLMQSLQTRSTTDQFMLTGDVRQMHVAAVSTSIDSKEVAV
jgi:hypothetical protein